MSATLTAPIESIECTPTSGPSASMSTEMKISSLLFAMAKNSLREIQFPPTRFPVAVPSSGLEVNLAQAGGFAGEEELLLEAGEEELLQLVEVRGAIDEDRERATMKALEGAVVVERVRDQRRPAFANLAELVLTLFCLLEEADHLRAEGFAA